MFMYELKSDGLLYLKFLLNHRLTVINLILYMNLIKLIFTQPLLNTLGLINNWRVVKNYNYFSILKTLYVYLTLIFFTLQVTTYIVNNYMKSLLIEKQNN